MKRNFNNEKRAGFLRRTAKEVKQYQITKKILLTALILLSLVLAVLYTTSVLYKKTGSFTVKIDRFEMNKYGLTLSEKMDMSHHTSQLNTEISEQITNIAEESIPANVDMQDGEHNGDNYIAYTFYLQNAGDVEVSYEYEVIMSNVTQDLDSAIRLRLYVNGEPTTYAKTKTDGSGPELGTVEFYSATSMAKGKVENFAPAQITKYTAVIWIEGNDPDCTDWLIGGELKIDMTFTIVK